MSKVYDRVGDAIFLWQKNRYEGALLSALIAIAGTARARYGEKLGDREAFERFLREAYPNDKEHLVTFRGKSFPIQTIFYKWLRNELVHSGSLPVDISFMGKRSNEMGATATGVSSCKLHLGHGWFSYLIHALVLAPENEGLIGSGESSKSGPRSG